MLTNLTRPMKTEAGWLPPWQETEKVSFRDAFEASGLNWDVQVHPLWTIPPAHCQIPGGLPWVPAEGINGVTRMDNGRVLGAVGDRYEPFQNSAVVEAIEKMVHALDATEEPIPVSMGVMKGGRRCFLQARLPGDLTVVGDDKIAQNVTFVWSHDGTSSLRAYATPTRMLCSNQLSFAWKHAKTRFRIRHTGDMSVKVDNATKVLASAAGANRAFVEFAQAATRVAFNGARLTEFVAAVLPATTTDKDGNEQVSTRLANQRARVEALFETGVGNDLPGVRGTGWAAINAVTQWVNYERGNNAETRFAGIFAGPGHVLTERAVQHVYALTA